MSDGGIVTVQSGQFNVTTNSGVSEAELSARLKPATDKARSEAASQLGKAGAEAKRAKAEAEPEPEEVKEEAEKPAERKIKPIPPKKEAKAEPEEVKAEPEDEEKPESEAKGEEKPEEPPKKDKRGDPRHDPNARIREATREAAEAKRQLAEERARREALEARLAPERATMPQERPQPQGKPNPSDFATTEEWLDARDAYNRSQWENELRRRAHEDAQQSHLNQIKQKFAEAAKPVVSQITADDPVGQLRPTFDLRPGEVDSGENWIANELILSPESAPTLMLYFKAQPDELQRIAALPNPRAVSREMAKLEARLEAATAGNTASSSEREDHSRATPPVRPVTGAPYVTESAEYKPGMSLDEYKKVWEKQTRRR